MTSILPRTQTRIPAASVGNLLGFHARRRSRAQFIIKTLGTTFQNIQNNWKMHFMRPHSAFSYLKLTAYQKEVFEREYRENPKPTYREKVELAVGYGAKILDVLDWFFNKQAEEVLFEEDYDGKSLQTQALKETVSKMTRKNPRTAEYECLKPGCSHSEKARSLVLVHYRKEHLSKSSNFIIFDRLISVKTFIICSILP